MKEILPDYIGYKKVFIEDNQELVSNLYSDKTKNWFNVLENEYLLIEDKDGNVVDKFKWQDGKYKDIYRKPVSSNQIEKIKPKNVEQAFAIDSLMDETTTVKVITGGFGSGKAMRNSTLIPTPNGYTKIGELKVGDYVYDRQGNPTRVLGVFPQGMLDEYRVEFSDGSVLYCNDEHMWSCLTSRGNIKTFTTREMIDKGLRKGVKYRFYIPPNGPAYKQEKEFKIHPYVIGAMIGDGCCLESALTISSDDESVVKKVSDLIGAKFYKRNGQINYSWLFYSDEKHRIQSSILPNEILRRSKDKEIPKEYMDGSISQRLELLRGLLDTDGSVSSRDKKKSRVSFSTTSVVLSNQVIELCQSLGIRATKYCDKRNDKYNSGFCCTICISCNYQKKSELFSLERKKSNICLEENKYRRDGNISVKSITKTNEKSEMTCIYVDNPEHIFLAEHYIPTHNTFLSTCASYQQMQAGKFDKIVWIRNNIDVKDTNPLGALPGTYEDKLSVWAMPLADHIGGKEELQKQIMLGQVEVEHLGFLRGRDIKNAIIFCSEAEHLTREHMQLLLGRVSEGSILILEGDATQIDKRVFEDDNGLYAIIDKLKGNKLFSYVHLRESVRSDTAKLADLLNKK